MIKTIAIKDFAIIKDTTFNFHEGLNIITGETGAGKSVVATAISLALGSRADSSFVRHGSEKAIVEISGNLRGDEFKISREITFNGKNTCKLNGETVPLSKITSYCKHLASIHGQFDNQALLNPDTHMDLVDRFGMEDIFPALVSYRKAYDEYLDAKSSYNKILSAEESGKKKEEFIRYSLNEISNGNLKVGEDLEIENKLSILQNSEKIASGINGAYEALADNEFSSVNSLGHGLSCLKSVSSYSEEIKELALRLETLSYELEDISSEVRTICDGLSFSPEEIDQHIDRLNLINNLKKKYGSTIEEILDYGSSLEEELDTIENFQERKDEAFHKLEELRGLLEEEGTLLTDYRKKYSLELSSAIKEQLQSLNFSNSLIEILFTKLDAPTSSGMDYCEIYISTNKGEPLKPLVKTASGGEVSRIMLAIKTITSSFENIPTMIFDEVDTGISGITASIVGDKLKALGKSKQVISITHLPQIAAKGDHNYRIYKESDENSTFTFVEELSYEAKVIEIARLLGGVNLTETAMKNARELIDG